MTDLDAAHESIELALDPPPTARLGIMRRLSRRATLRLGQAHARHQQAIDRQLLGLIGSLETRLHDAVGSLEARLEHAVGRLTRLEQTTEELGARSHTAAEQTRSLGEQTRSLEEQAGVLGMRVSEVERHLGAVELFQAQVQALPDPELLGLERFDANEAGTVIGYRHAASPVSPEDDYVAFEDVFRLSEDVIRERQRPYVSLLGERQPVLDAGCGRGEFLELLRDAGVQARGVDLDPGMVARAHAKSLDVEQGDLVAHLSAIADGSLGVVFAAQVVEHLSYAELLAFLRLAYQKLKPNGLLIAETVNPHAPGTLKSFWTDPTHQHPIFPEVLLTLCRGIGFASAYVFHPGGTGDVDTDRLQRGDYAVVAERGGPPEPGQASGPDEAGSEREAAQAAQPDQASGQAGSEREAGQEAEPVRPDTTK